MLPITRAFFYIIYLVLVKTSRRTAVKRRSAVASYHEVLWQQFRVHFECQPYIIWRNTCWVTVLWLQHASVLAGSG